MVITIIREKTQHVSTCVLLRVHLSHNSDCNNGSAQPRGHGVKEESSAFVSKESNFTKRSHFAQEEIKSVENLLHFK